MARELKAVTLARKIKELQLELHQHQEKCKHKKVTFEYGANTGNFCEVDDSYWKDYSCPTCLKRWTEYY